MKFFGIILVLLVTVAAHSFEINYMKNFTKTEFIIEIQAKRLNQLFNITFNSFEELIRDGPLRDIIRNGVFVVKRRIQNTKVDTVGLRKFLKETYKKKIRNGK